MAVTAQTPINVTEANGVTTTFPYNFLILDAADLLVRVSGVAKTLNVDYTVTGVGNQAGGNVVFTVAPAFGTTVVRQRVMPYERAQDYQTNGDFAAAEVNADFDRPVMMIQQLAEAVARALLLPPELAGTVSLLPQPESLRGVRWNAAANGLENYTISDFTHPDGAANVGYTPAGASVFRTVQDKLREVVSVKDFGARGDGVTNDTAAFQAAIAYAQSVTPRGATIYVPRGEYRVTQTLVFTASSLVHGVRIKGDGDFCTVINFAGIAAASDGIAFGAGAHFSIEDLYVANATRHNIVIGRGTTVGGPDYCNIFTMKNVRSQGAGQDGVFIQNSYLGTLSNVWSKNNGRNGFTFAGFQTALDVGQCEASDNAGIGYSINGIVYSHFTACGSDVNALQGWAISNAQAVVFSGCGAETNGRDGWLLFTSSASATGLNAQSDNIRGVEFVGCYGLANSTAGAGTYATFIGASTADSRPITFSVRGGIAHPGAAGDRAYILAGTSGQVTAITDGFDAAAFSTADSISGTVNRENKTVAGRRVILTNSTAQSIPDTGADTTFTNWNTTPVVNTLGATVSSSAITIPRGVNRVRVTANVGWENDGSAGTRVAKIFRNGAGFAGMAAEQKLASGFTLTNLSTAVFDVSEGQTISLMLAQQSGAARNTLGASNSFTLCVEAVG